MQVTSVASESCFSEAGNLVSDSRTLLKDDSVRANMFQYFWLQVVPRNFKWNYFYVFAQSTLSMLFCLHGPEDTSYDSGRFVIDIYFPLDYPQIALQFQMLKTCGGRVRMCAGASWIAGSLMEALFWKTIVGANISLPLKVTTTSTSSTTMTAHACAIKDRDMHRELVS